MRDKLFRKLLGAAEKYDPQIVRLFEIKVLSNLAARSFGTRKGSIAGSIGQINAIVLKSGADRALANYAAFTRSCMDAQTASPAKLYGDAFRLGSFIRKLTGFTQQSDLDRLIIWLYRNIDISMSGSTADELIVSDCYFGRHYTPEQCAVMSNVDSGIISGICGGGRLVFTERITEGCGRCRACLEKEEQA